MIHQSFTRLSLLGLLCAPLGTLGAASIDSEASGNWNDTGTWVGDSIPQTGGSDTANILSGHTVIYTDTGPGAGLDGSGDLGTGNGNSININGGVLSQAMDGWWVRIGHKGAGTLNITEGRFHITDGTGGGTQFQVGVEANGNGTVIVGDGTGADGSAVLNLRDRVDGSSNGGPFDMNLGASDNTAGSVTVNSDGVLEGDQRMWDGGNPYQNPHVRIGQQPSGLQSSLTVNEGGQFNARGNVEVGANGGAKGLLHLTGAGARMDMSDGELTVGFNGTGVMVVENGAVFSRSNTSGHRSDLLVGRGGGNGTITIASGGQFRRESGGEVGDMRIGLGGTGVLNVEEGGLYHNESGNWDWLGQDATGNGTVNVNGGTFEITGGTNLIVGLNGTGTYNHNSGTTNVHGIRAGMENGTGSINIGGGTFNVREALFLGGDWTGSGGAGSATVNQSGGATSVGSALVVGIAANHTGTYNLTGGTVTHTGSDISIGESGTGTFTIAAGAALTSTTDGQFYVGRNEGSSGTLIVDGALTKTGSASAIRVGNGNGDGVDNTTAPGLLGGTGTIASDAGVRIGTHGTVTAGLTTTIGSLDITGALGFSSGGTLHVDYDGTASTIDLLNVTGVLDITNATVDFDPLTTALTGDPYIFATYGSLSGSEFATVIDLPGGYSINYTYGGNSIALVPEPTAAALLLLAALGATRRRRTAA